MSTARDRIRRSSRLHQEKNAIRRQIQIARDHGMMESKSVQQPHRLAKHHAMNCGNPRCVFCSNPRRIWKEKTLQEKKAEQNLDE